MSVVHHIEMRKKVSPRISNTVSNELTEEAGPGLVTGLERGEMATPRVQWVQILCLMLDKSPFLPTSCGLISLRVI